MYHLVLTLTLIGSLAPIGQCETPAAKADRVTNLPGLPYEPSFGQYSGYLNGSTDNIQLHYWFFESVEEKDTAPLVLWLNGGPGCSSITGLLEENGPFRVMPNQTLTYNPDSWNKFSNILFLTAPAFVGYSYAKNGVNRQSDDLTSLNNYFAILSFLEKFPEYKGREFYITGESYAGVYLPTLALRILSDKSGLINLKGIAAGNPLVDYQTDFNSQWYFMYYHGLVDQDLWDQALNTCCPFQCSSDCDFFSIEGNDQCVKLLNELDANVEGIDPYNIYSPCDGGAPTSTHSRRRERKNLMRFAKKSRTRLFRGGSDGAEGGEEEEEPDYSPCQDDTTINGYMNQPDVRKALNIPDEAPKEWDVCNDEIFEIYEEQYGNLEEEYLRILEQGVPVLIYVGDTDLVINVVGVSQWFDQLNLPERGPLQPWLYTAPDNSTQIGGMVKEYEYMNQTFTFATVRGSGHFVPTDKPVASYHMITQFIKGESL